MNIGIDPFNRGKSVMEHFFTKLAGPPLLSMLLVLSVLGCKKVCEYEEINYADLDFDLKTEVEWPYPDGDPDDYVPPDGDELEAEEEMEAEPEAENDSEFQLDGDWDLPPADQDPTDIGEQEPEELVLLFDDREVLEKSPFGFWQYDIRKGESDTSHSVATLHQADPTGTVLATNEGADYTSNPPCRSSMMQVSDNIAWAAYTPFDADSRVPEKRLVILRRERKISDTLYEIKYFHIEPPERSQADFRQVALLPYQDDILPQKADEEVNLLLIYASEAEDSAVLQSQAVKAVTADSTVTLTPRPGQEWPTTVALTGGLRARTKVRIVAGKNAIWVNGGGVLCQFDPMGELPETYIVDYYAGMKRDIVDFALSPNEDDGEETYLSLVMYSEKGDLRYTSWMILDTADPTEVLKEWRFGSTYDYYRTNFTPDARYAVVANADPNVFNDFYILDTRTGTWKIKGAYQVNWGRPLFLENPTRLLTAFPVSLDSFETVSNRIAITPFADIVSGAFALEN